MSFWSRVKPIEYGLALGTVIFLVWNPLSLMILTLFDPGTLSRGTWSTLLVAGLSDLGLVISLGLGGLLAGFMLTSGRFTVVLVAGGLAWAFRISVFLISGNPHPPWHSGPEVLAHLAMFALAILVALFLFGRVVHRGPRRPAAEPSELPGPPKSQPFESEAENDSDGAA